jgi:hypothetical protein
MQSVVDRNVVMRRMTVSSEVTYDNTFSLCACKRPSIRCGALDSVQGRIRALFSYFGLRACRWHEVAHRGRVWGVQPPSRNSEGPPKSFQTQPECENC